MGVQVEQVEQKLQIQGHSISVADVKKAIEWLRNEDFSQWVRDAYECSFCCDFASMDAYVLPFKKDVLVGKIEPGSFESPAYFLGQVSWVDFERENNKASWAEFAKGKDFVLKWERSFKTIANILRDFVSDELEQRNE